MRLKDGAAFRRRERRGRPIHAGLRTLLSLWVALAILAGLVLGQIAPGIVGYLAGLEYGSVNFVVAVLIWFMVYPMMVAVDFSSLARVHERPKGMIITLAVNWLIKPFTMAALGVLFFEWVFGPFIQPGTAGQYIAGLILLGAAPCTAMVFVWSQLTKGGIIGWPDIHTSTASDPTATRSTWPAQR